MTSILVLVAIAYDRYIAVCRPFSVKKRCGTPVLQGILHAAICVAVSVVMAFPQPIIYKLVVKYDENFPIDEPSMLICADEHYSDYDK